MLFIEYNLDLEFFRVIFLIKTLFNIIKSMVTDAKRKPIFKTIIKK
jgi:hypothetical protein